MYIVDMHCDTLLSLDENTHLRNNDLDIDLIKMKQSNYLLQNFAIFTNYDKVKDRVPYVLKNINKFYKEIEANKDLIKQVFSYKDIEENKLMSAMLTLEEGDVINNDLDILELYYRLGVRMIALTWNFKNSIGSPNFTPNPDRYQMLRTLNTIDGLTDFGKEYIKKCNELGIIIDVSHLGDKGFEDVLELSTKPIVASHSNARAICDVARNLSDEMILKLHKNNGVMGMNFCEDFISNDSNGSVENIIKHIDHIKELGCIDNIGLGSDFDGIKKRKEMS
ncbi:MAG: membrane dipeptidase, partial [Solobacterium sp.]|nr:membrane dipeptidase [Solobacterium sp.]